MPVTQIRDTIQPGFAVDRDIAVQRELAGGLQRDCAHLVHRYVGKLAKSDIDHFEDEIDLLVQRRIITCHCGRGHQRERLARHPA